MKSLEEIRKLPRLTVIQVSEDGGNGWLRISRSRSEDACVVWSNGGGWDHVSVSFARRCPTWEEMCAVKEMFFLPEEVCIEYHPAKSEYVNVHPYCLHIWRPQKESVPTPPRIFV